MKHSLLLIILLVGLAACTNEATPSPAEGDPATVEWPENFNFCRPNPDDPTEPADCISLETPQEWLDYGPMIGDVIWVWPENLTLPPLPEGMAWSRERDPSNGESFWLIVES